MAQAIKNPPASAGDLGSISVSGRSPGEGNGYPLQYSCLQKFTERGAWWVTVHGAAKNQTQLSNQSAFHTERCVSGDSEDDYRLNRWRTGGEESLRERTVMQGL